MDEIGKGNKVLLIGNSGQLGSRISDFLTAKGYKVITPVRIESRNTLFRNNIDVEATIRSEHWDFVVNAASPAAKLANQMPEEAVGWATLHGNHLNQLSNMSALGRGIHLSSVQVYGSPLTGTVDELTEPKTISGYGAMHRMLEYSLFENTGWLILRLSNVFGHPGRGGVSDDSLFTHSIAKSLAIHGRATVTANPGIRKDFLPASQVVEAIHWSLRSEAEVTGVVNLASGDTITLRDWARQIECAYRELGARGNVHLKTRFRETPSFHFSSAKLRRLGFKGTSSASKELRSLLEFMVG